MPGVLEYEEEDDYFASDSESAQIPAAVNSATPIAGPSRLGISPASGTVASSSRSFLDDTGPRVRPPPAPCPPDHRVPVLKPSVGLSNARPRLLELKEIRERKPPEPPTIGPVSLKQQCMAVLRANSTRIWDIGDVEYHLVKDFIDRLPPDQLAEIEEASPQIRKDTDWLWEYFLLTDYSASHSKYAERKGERRTSGWRRMYRKAAEEARERQQNAAERVAERYREMDKERAEKRIVVLNQVVQPKKGRRPAGAVFGAQKGLQVTAKTSTFFDRARADTQRARIAMTHATGKYVPPSSSPSRPGAVRGGGAKATSAAAPSRGVPTPTPVTGPRIPAPRSKVNGPSASSSDIIPEAYPTSEYNVRRAALPEHLTTASSSRTGADYPPTERFIHDPKPVFKTVPKADVPNFRPPVAEAKKVRADFFRGAAATASPVAAGAKRQRSEAGDQMPSPFQKAARPGEAAVPTTTITQNNPRSTSAPSHKPPSTVSVSPGMDTAKLKNVLFRSKPKQRAGHPGR